MQAELDKGKKEKGGDEFKSVEYANGASLFRQAALDYYLDEAEFRASIFDFKNSVGTTRDELKLLNKFL